MQLTFVSSGFWTKTAPPPSPPDCATAAGLSTSAQPVRAAAAPPAGIRLCRNSSRPLFRRPTGLADGLAPEERRYDRSPADSPPRRPLSTASERFPRSRTPLLGGGIRQALNRRGSIAALPVWIGFGFRKVAGLGRVPHYATGRRRSGVRADPLCFMKTYVATPASRERNWLVVDASGKTLGRLATQIADTLRGKRKPDYTPHLDVGDFVIVVNAERISVTGRKREQKLYYRHSGYPGGLRSRTLAEMLERRPEEVVRKAVKGMLPRTRLGRAQLRKLKVYAGPDHPHAAQQPEPMEVEA